MFILKKIPSLVFLLLSSALLWTNLAGAAEKQTTLPMSLPENYSGDNMNVSYDLYGVQTNLMPYNGYQNDLAPTAYFRFSDSNIIPFARYVVTNYYFLNSMFPPGNTVWTTDRRTSLGIGLDYRYNDYLKFRFIVESIDNSGRANYTQDSYGIIYNQYLAFAYFDLNNYLETFFIPRVSSRSADTFFKSQALKPFDISRTITESNVVYPFAQVKVKLNDDNNFGVTGQNLSVGPGYKYYSVNAQKDSFTIVVEAHSVLHQSKNFNGDWMQFLAAFQLWID